MSRYPSVFALVFIVALSGSVAAQVSPNYTLSFESGVAGLVGDNVTVSGMFGTLPSAQAIEGWSFGICHPPTPLTPILAVAGSTTQTVKNGSPPDFMQMNVNPTGTTSPVVSTPGVNQAVVICFTGCASLPPGTGYELIVVTYSLSGPAGVAPLNYCGTTLGGTLVAIVVVVAGQSIVPTTLPGAVEALGAPALANFVSGECNGDGISDLADGIHLINELFASGPATVCPAACDTNADGALELDDAVLGFNFLFLSGPPPAAPFPGCGTRAGVFAADCSYPLCP
ncbi:MAG: hypothetical protein ACKVX7_15435 [Planctomycetota bacterium]